MLLLQKVMTNLLPYAKGSLPVCFAAFSTGGCQLGSVRGGYPTSTVS